MIKIIHNINNNQVIAVDENEIQAGYLSYTLNGKIINAEHTVVKKEYGGQGIAKMLLNELVDYARKSDLKINPVCSFIVSQFEKNSDIYKDIIA